MTLNLTCAFEVLILPNERVFALFHHFSLQVVHISLKSVQKRMTPQLQDPVQCISQILPILICILVEDESFSQQ